MDTDEENARTLLPLQAAATTYRIAFGPRAGQKILTLQRAMPREAPSDQALCANAHGFSLHAAVRCDTHQRQSLEQLCRYITRPAIADERVQCNAAGQVVLKLKTAWRDGTTHLLMSPLEFMQRLAALVPRPRLHLIRFHGVLAPNSKLRASVVPTESAQNTGATACNAHTDATQGSPGRSHIPWARLLKRVFALDLEHCPNCAGKLTIIAAIVEAKAIDRILSHLGLQTRAAPRSAPRAALNAA